MKKMLLAMLIAMLVISSFASAKTVDDKQYTDIKYKDIKNQLSTETSFRISNDTLLQSKINAERDARIAKDTDLQNQIDSFFDIFVEVGSFNNIILDLTNRLAGEAYARMSADTNLQNQIDSFFDVFVDVRDSILAKNDEQETKISELHDKVADLEGRVAALETCTQNMCGLLGCVDNDHDGYGPGCAQGTDCNDNNAAINPVASETCDNLDNDCDGSVDEQITLACGSDMGTCRKGVQTCNAGNFGSCEGSTNPTSEICDGRDNDCNGVVDESNICPLPDGTPCNDGNACTVSDAYLNGQCVGNPRDCNDGNQCTTDACDRNIDVCIHTPVPDNTFCGNNGHCISGVCI